MTITVADLDPTTANNFRATAQAIEDDVASGIPVEDALAKLSGFWRSKDAFLALFSPSVQAMLNKREVLREQAVLRAALDEAEPETAPAAQRGRRRL
ncbi:TPA: hypothetical protein QDB01_000328 [Burkholderia vietnamiensis]|nr:hypothetical protein [Burkholderia vietnamiensis]